MGIVKETLYGLSKKNWLSLVKKETIYPYYHIVGNVPVAHIENLYQYKNVAQFRYDIEVLLKNYKPLDPKDLLENKVKDNQFLLTFDDGLAEVYTVIYPILKEKNIKAVFFLNPDFIDNEEGLYKHYLSLIITHLKKTDYDKTALDHISAILSFSYTSTADFKTKLINTHFKEREKVQKVLNYLKIDIQEYLKETKPYLTKAQIKEMIADGFYFGGHTMSHFPLSQLSHEAQKKQIVDSVTWVKEQFALPYSLFAFPFTDKSISKKLIHELFEFDPSLLLFGNSGLKKDIDKRIIQRFSLENPTKATERQIVTENLYKYFNKLIGKYHIKRS